MQFIWKTGLWKVNLPIPGSEKKGTGGIYQVKKEVKYKEFVGTKKQVLQNCTETALHKV